MLACPRAHSRKQSEDRRLPERLAGTPPAASVRTGFAIVADKVFLAPARLKRSPYAEKRQDRSNRLGQEPEWRKPCCSVKLSCVKEVADRHERVAHGGKRE